MGIESYCSLFYYLPKIKQMKKLLSITIFSLWYNLLFGQKQMLLDRLYLMSVLSIFLLFISCEKDNVETNNTPDNSDNVETNNTPDNSENLFGTGWNSDENFSQTIPVAINYSNYQSGNTLPSSIDLTSKFPPIGNQGYLGTCVAWAAGYYTKTYLDAIAKNLTPSQTQSWNNQYSPTDLFFSINPSLRSCEGGTHFDYAFTVLRNRGVNTLADVPYDEVCYSNSPGSDLTASANRIKNYRWLQQGSVNEIKEYLAQGIPVVIGAMVNEEFKQLRGSGILKNLNYFGNEGGHAMVIAGYDDSRSAFRIVNSWGVGWGDNGYLWIDYNFLVNKFCIQGGERIMLVAYNNNTTTVNPPTSVGGPDLTAIVTADGSLYPNTSPYINARRAFFDVKNIGNQTMLASSNWNIYYLWVNAFDANNYGIIFRGEFTTTIPPNSFLNINANYTLLNYNLAPGATLGQISFGLQYSFWDYFMPQVTGSYYLVMYIDKGNSNETNQTNNVFYVTQSPKSFSNGYSNKISPNKFENKYQFENLSSFKFNLTESDFNDEESLNTYRKLSNKDFANSYTSQEIVSFLKYKIKNGGL